MVNLNKLEIEGEKAIPLICRSLVLIGLIFRFFFAVKDLKDSMQIVFWIGILVILFISIIIGLKRDYINIYLFTITDSLVILVCIYMTKDPETDLFLFLILPIIYVTFSNSDVISVLILLITIIIFYVLIAVILEIQIEGFNIFMFLRNTIIKSGFLFLIGYILIYYKLKTTNELKLKETLIELSFYSIIAVDNNGIITNINKKALEFLGYNKNEVIGNRVEKFYSKFEDPRKIKASLIQNKSLENYKTFLKNKDGKEIPIELSTKIFGNGGSVGYFEDTRENKIKNLIESGRKILNMDLKESSLISEILNQTIILTCGQEFQEDVYCCYSSYKNDTVEIEETSPNSVYFKIPDNIKKRNIELEDKIGIVGKSIKSKMTINCNDTTNDIDFLQIDGLTTNSILAIPLKNDGKIVGALSISHPRKNYFNISDVQAFETIGLFYEIMLMRHNYHSLLKGITEINSTIPKGSLDFDTLDKLVLIIKNALMCDIVTLHIYISENDKFIYPFANIGLIHEDAIKVEGELLYESPLYKIKNQINDEIIKCENISNCPIFDSSFNKRENVKSVFASKLIFDNNMVGVLILSYRSMHVFSEKEISYLKLYCHSISSAIYNFNVKNKLERKYKTIEGFTEAILKVNAIERSKDIGTKILEATQLLIQFDRASYQVISEEGERDVVSTVNCNREDYDDYQLRNIKNDMLLRRIFEEGKNYFIEDVSINKYFEKLEFTKNVISWIGIPIIYDNRNLGLITLDFYKKYEFDKSISSLLQTFAVFLSNVIENLNLGEKHIQYINQLEEADSNAMRGLLYGEDIHFAANKLGAAKQYIENIMSDEKLLNDQSIKYLQRSYVNIDNFLDLIEANFKNIKVPIPKSFNLAQTIESVLRALPNPSRIKIENKTRDTTLIVFGFQRQVTQVFRVVIHNAFCVLNSDGILKIEMAKLDDDTVKVSIIDNGPGIPMEIRDRIFKFNGPNLSKKSFGVGLGWAKYFLTEYGGDINFETEVDLGTTFSVKIPMNYTKSVSKRLGGSK